MVYRVKHLTPNPKTRLCIKRERLGPFIPVNGVVFHWAANYGASIQNMWDFFEKKVPKDPAEYARMYHYVVREEIWEFMPTDEIGGSVGLTSLDNYPSEIRDRFLSWPDHNLISVLMLEDAPDGAFASITLDNATLLGAKLFKQFGINNIDCSFRHFDITKKVCPKFFVDHEDKWKEFQQRVMDILEIWNI